MKRENEEWVVGLYEDHFNCDDTYPSKEEAIKAGREELMNAEPYNIKSYASYSEVFHDDIDDDVICFFVGRITSPCPKVYADDIIQDLTDRAYAIYGEYAEGFLDGVDGECEVNKFCNGELLTKFSKEWRDDSKWTVFVEYFDVYEFKVIPFRPKIGDWYYHINILGNPVHGAFKQYNTFDCLNRAIGNCFRTKELAEAHKEEILKILKGENDE